MNKKILQSLSVLLSKMPKKDLEKNLEKVKKLANNSNKEELKKLLSDPQISKILGNDSEIIKEKIDSIDFNNINTDKILNENIKR